jgi:hypothetical protein
MLLGVGKGVYNWLTNKICDGLTVTHPVKEWSAHSAMYAQETPPFLLSWATLVHSTPTSSVSNINLNLAILGTRKPSKRSLPFCCPNQNSICISTVCYACHIFLLVCLPRFLYPNDIYWEVPTLERVIHPVFWTVCYCLFQSATNSWIYATRLHVST